MPEKLSIVGGMFLISSIFYLIFTDNSYGGFTPFGPAKQIADWTTFPGFALAGFLVGFGTKLGNGCTSGHGLCGLSRFSLRSFVAVGIFLMTAIGISTLSFWVGLGPFVNDQDLSPVIHYNNEISAIVFLLVGLILPVIGFFIAKKEADESFNISKQFTDQLIVFGVGILFAIGLMLSGMSVRNNILGFLQINNQWNCGLLFVLGCGLGVNVITFTVMRRKGTSILGNKVFDPQNSKIDLPLVLGAFCFGLGWGIGGLCPGPFLVLFPAFTVPIQVLWGVSLVLGMFLAKFVGPKLSPSSEPAKPTPIESDMVSSQRQPIVL